MSKATPIPDLIKSTGRGQDFGTCGKCGGKITRVTGSRELSYPWWHVETGRVFCMEKDGGV